jgi:hypothetical protein
MGGSEAFVCPVVFLRLPANERKNFYMDWAYPIYALKQVARLRGTRTQLRAMERPYEFVIAELKSWRQH